MEDVEIASNDEVAWADLEMPAAPESSAIRRFYSEWPLGKIMRSATSFALFSVSILLTVWAFGLLTEGILGGDDAYQVQRKEFRDLTGFDSVTTDGSGVAVCIVDTGIDLSHPNVPNDIVAGWKDFINSRDAPYDDGGHGTSMAGILIADDHIPGMAQGVELYVAKAIAKTGTGTDEGIASAVDWCVEQNVDVISLSLGGSQGVDFIVVNFDSLENAVNNAIDQGIFVVAAAGNDGENDDGDVSSPGSETDVICVGGIDSDGDIWSGSSKGDQGVNFPERWLPRNDPNKKPELVAPGENVPVLCGDACQNSGGFDSDYVLSDGTSAATVWVTAAIAHLLEIRPDLQHDGTAGGKDTVSQVKTWIKDTSTPSPEQGEHDDYYGYGHLQIDTLLQIAGQD
ncbi:MAG: S8 family serine peptidase [Candidatus Thalassarchaeaceae archaeon]|jgi:subtilisin family serine protease|nr:S8 family serine peptidase [Candidatus Thalassarchaeaceae archaeon]